MLLALDNVSIYVVRTGRCQYDDCMPKDSIEPKDPVVQGC